MICLDYPDRVPDEARACWAFATAFPDFSGEMGSCVSANTKNLGFRSIPAESRDRQQEFMNTEKLNTMLYIYIYIYMIIIISIIIIIYIYMIYDMWYIILQLFTEL